MIMSFHVKNNLCKKAYHVPVAESKTCCPCQWASIQSLQRVSLRNMITILLRNSDSHNLDMRISFDSCRNSQARLEQGQRDLALKCTATFMPNVPTEYWPLDGEAALEMNKFDVHAKLKDKKRTVWPSHRRRRRRPMQRLLLLRCHMILLLIWRYRREKWQWKLRLSTLLPGLWSLSRTGR